MAEISQSNVKPKKKHILLIREDSTAEGTFGIMTCGDRTWCTGELPWRENQAFLSCIPLGTYGGLWTDSPKYKRKMYLIVGKHGREGIRIHSANFVGDKAHNFKSQVLGCITLGKSHGKLQGQKAVLSSRNAVKDFEDFMAGEDFVLEIKKREDANV